MPLVVRMKGTNEELGKKILKDSGLPIISADNMADAAKKVVAAIKKKPKPSQRSARPTEKGEEIMSILIDRNTRVMTQGITGKTGQFHTQTSRAYANGRRASSPA